MEGDTEFSIVCPFHGDTQPSLKINLAEGFFYCFGCQAHGNAFDFIKYAYPKHDDLLCLLKYHKVLNSNKVKRIQYKQSSKPRKLNNKQALVEASDYYYGLKTVNWLTSNLPEKQYMNERGFTSKTLNLCHAKYTYNKHYPLIFPMLDLGVFKGWVCRATNKRIEAKRKYLYNTGFSRKTTIVGDYANSVVILVEGYMDWLKLRQYGLNYVGAILGWKVTSEQVQKLKEQGVKVVISALDNDLCGDKGTKHLHNFFDVIRFKFPQGVKDPGDITKEQFEKEKQRINRRLYKYAKRIN